MPVNRSLSPLRAYGRNFVAMPLVLSGTGVAFAMEVLSGPPGVLVDGPDGFGVYLVQLPGEGRFSQLVVTGHCSQISGAICMIDNIEYDPANRTFGFRFADYTGGIPVVRNAGLGDIATFSIFVDNS